MNDANHEEDNGKDSSWFKAIGIDPFDEPERPPSLDDIFPGMGNA